MRRARPGHDRRRAAGAGRDAAVGFRPWQRAARPTRCPTSGYATARWTAERVGQSRTRCWRRQVEHNTCSVGIVAFRIPMREGLPCANPFCATSLADDRHRIRVFRRVRRTRRHLRGQRPQPFGLISTAIDVLIDHIFRGISSGLSARVRASSVGPSQARALTAHRGLRPATVSPHFTGREYVFQNVRCLTISGQLTATRNQRATVADH